MICGILTVFFDKRGIITDVKPAGEKMTGFPAEEVIGKPIDITRSSSIKKNLFVWLL
ncbi:PAS domain S-box protein [Bacillus songklensis]|uniref:PAS domain S-box protein n=1 Tax=Bacillus songklensis TaxID=1069116 RepID=A0ABV8B4K9_9BACI